MTFTEQIKTVCVIDDDEIYVYGLKKLISIKQLCPDLIEFKNGKEAIDFLMDPQNDHQIPDIIFLDINMPVMDGWDFMESFVKIKPRLGKKITIYMVSSSVNDQDIERAKNIAEITDYISKPVTPARLVELFSLAA